MQHSSTRAVKRQPHTTIQNDTLVWLLRKRELDHLLTVIVSPSSSAIPQGLPLIFRFKAIGPRNAVDANVANVIDRIDTERVGFGLCRIGAIHAKVCGTDNHSGRAFLPDGGGDLGHFCQHACMDGWFS